MVVTKLPLCHCVPCAHDAGIRLARAECAVGIPIKDGDKASLPLWPVVWLWWFDATARRSWSAISRPCF